MIPVTQRIISGTRGDCFSACIASILELPYEDVPRFVTDAVDRGAEHEWLRDTFAWLKPLGLTLVDINARDLHDYRGLVGLYVLLSVPSQKFPGGGHSVVGTWIKEGGGHTLAIAHDPNPYNDPYPPEVDIQRITFVVPFNLVKFKQVSKWKVYDIMADDETYAITANPAVAAVIGLS